MKLNIIKKDLMDPLAEMDSCTVNINPIPEHIDVISLLDNTKPGADLVLLFIEDNLDDKQFIHVKKPAGAPATTNQIQKAGKADLAILAIGDCGSCSSWVILDAIRLEKMGIPTVSICSDVFNDFAHKLANSHGASDLRIFSVDHPIAGLSKEEVDAKINAIFPSICSALNIL